MKRIKSFQCSLDLHENLCQVSSPETLEAECIHPLRLWTNTNRLAEPYKDLQSEHMCQRLSTVKQMHTTQANKHERCRQTRQLYETTEKSDQQSNNNQGTADSERAVDSTARGKLSKRQRDVASRKDIKKRIS